MIIRRGTAFLYDATPIHYFAEEIPDAPAA